MTSSAMRGARRGMGVLAAGSMLISGHATTAQAPDRSRLPPGAIVQPLEDPAGAEHRRNLTTLANNPRSVSALIGAGRSAVAMGDGEAALSFFARADEIEPRNPRVKAGMASALVLLERGEAALPLFAEAISLGAPEAEIAGDRGLAFDMTGDPRRAQQDYALVLRRGDHPEIRRRLALSLAISGRREAALEAIAGQLRQQDRAAWRTQAFILALTGDADGASETAARMMPGAGRSMAPFFSRLAGLSPAQKAMAVHFGQLPRGGGTEAVATVDTNPDPGALELARADSVPRAEPVMRPPVVASPEPARVERRRPDAPAASGGVRERMGLGRRADRDPEFEIAERRQPEPQRFEPPQPDPEPAREPAPVPTPVRRPEPEPAATQPAPVEIADAGSFTTIAPGFELEPGNARTDDPTPAGVATLQPETGPVPSTVQPIPEPAPAQLGDLAAVIAGLPDPPAPESERSRPPARAETRPAPLRTPTRRAAQPAHEARRWVQLATLPSRAGLAGEFSRLRSRAPEALRSRAAYQAPYGRSSHRLLVGPFDTARAAQDMVNQLRRADIEAFAWTSEAGQEIDRVQTANATRSARNQPQPARARGAGSRPRAEPRPAARGRRTRG